MSRFYTNVAVVGSNVLVREIVDGIPNMRKEQWQPTLYVRGNPKDGAKEFSTLYGEPAYAVQPGTIVDTKDFVKQYDGVRGFPIFGQLNYSLQYMHQYKPTGWLYKLLSVWSIDIETEVPTDSTGATYFPTPEKADGAVLAITLVNMHTGEAFTWGLNKEYTKRDTKYTRCIDEYNLFRLFLEFWESKRVDVITGWNINGFDIPYLYNRIVRIVGEENVKRLSPWGRVHYKARLFKGRMEYDTSITGVSILDYIDLYKKYTYIKHESYSLGHIAMVELGTTKVDHSEYASFNEFWQKDWEKFIHYNVKDTLLVKMLDDKLKLIELVLTVAYEAHINFEDVSSPVKTWDAIISNYCIDRGIVLPQQEREESKHLEGAYVKDPVPGWYYNVVSLDATSLYPSIIMTNNISPETWVGNVGYTIDDFLCDRDVQVDGDKCVTPIGAVYKKDKRGILPELVEYFMKLRKSAKGEMLALEQQYENTKDESLTPKIAALDNKQMAYKILMNSLYGATAQENFRFFKHDHAASITLTGQYVLRQIENSIDDILNDAFKTKGLKYLIYIDTDSLYFTFDELFKQYGVTEDKAIKTIEKLAKEKITPLVNRVCEACCIKMNSYDNKLSFKLEVAASKSIWLAKKKYVLRVHSSEGVTYEKPKFKAKGLEMVRSSTPQFVRDKLKAALDIIFDTNEKKVQEYIESVRQEFMTLEYQQVAFPRGANNLEEYSDDRTIYKKGNGFSTPIQVRGALLYNHYLKEKKLDGKYATIGEGDKIKFIYLKLPNRLKENVIAFPAEGVVPPEFNVADKFDYEMQFEKTFLASMEIILDAIKWQSIETSSLEDFFG